MDVNAIPLLSLLQSKLNYVGERQKLIAQNVANASTPGFTPQDLKPFSQQPGLKAGPGPAAVVLAQPERDGAAGGQGAGFISLGGKAAQPFASKAAPDSETTLNGNQVVLEEQMMKMSDARTEYDAAIGFYQQSLQMLQSAVKKPGG